MSGRSTLAPSKSTVYISSLPFSLTNNDVIQLCQNYGKVVKVTIVKDHKRRSKGIAFVLFLTREDAANCISELDQKQMFGRTLKATFSRDNGRAAEFIRRREYPDKSKCYECGEDGHLSYKCQKNMLGHRDPPPKKKRIKTCLRKLQDDLEDESENEAGEDPALETLGAAIRFEQESLQEGFSSKSGGTPTRTKRFKKSMYFSDEEEVGDSD